MFKNDIYDERLIYDWDVDIDTGWKEWQSIVLQALVLTHTKYHTIRIEDVYSLVRNQLDVLEINYKSVDPKDLDESVAISSGDEIGLESAIYLYIVMLVRNEYLIDLSKKYLFVVDGYQITSKLIDALII